MCFIIFFFVKFSNPCFFNFFFPDCRWLSRKLHAIKGPTLGVAEKNAPIHYQAEVIVVREKPLHISDISSEGGESVKEEGLVSLEV